ncbi:hypothetical protein [uncultured Tenacibaculum sp.]|uniref:hypothetical protein n=1 Tax=uncultured Tenacibaculum sp. TaxID=174713 RepID=UPI00262176F6|nr:hypothetical protein [uncultured Tenacibaculum sp.]
MKQDNPVVGIVIVLIILSTLIYSISKAKELSSNGVKTEAKIVKYYRDGGKLYIRYVFFVNRKKISNETRVLSFKCDNGVKGCVGEKFKVIYSPDDPSNNNIDLGKYNKYKFGTKIFELIKE